MSEIFVHILGITSVLLAIAGALYSLIKLIESKQASDSLQSRLVLNRKDKLLRLMREINKDSSYHEAARIIEKELPYLSEVQRRQITEALWQPTIKGRRSYVKNVIERTAEAKHAQEKMPIRMAR
jgi:hypothetical protein